jgi:hypothetical protein
VRLIHPVRMSWLVGGRLPCASGLCARLVTPLCMVPRCGLLQLAGPSHPAVPQSRAHATGFVSVQVCDVAGEGGAEGVQLSTAWVLCLLDGSEGCPVVCSHSVW